MAPRFLRFWRHLTPATLKTVIVSVGRRRLPGLSAEVAYNAMLAMFPAILAVLTAIGLVKSSAATFEQLGKQLVTVVPEDASAIIHTFIQELSRTPNQGLFSLSFIVALWASSGAVSATMNALDDIHQIPLLRRRPFWLAKLVSLGLTIGSILLLVLAAIVLFVSDFIVQVVAELNGSFEGLLTLWRLLTFPLAMGIIVVLSAFLYRFGPSRWTSGTPILPGALLAAIFWLMLSSGFRFYVSRFGTYNRAYGAIGAVIVLLLWLQLTSLMLLIGAQLNVTVGQALRAEKGIGTEG